jgi:hypothetical protein
MSLIPLTRAAMREIKAAKDEELNKIKRVKIDAIIKAIYANALKFAEVSEVTEYKVHIGPYGVGGLSKEFIVENMKEILRILQPLFPDSVVEYKKLILARGISGIEYDVSSIGQYIDNEKARTEEYIMIDWT